jgi:putative intracellular protease/amidase|mmetsp:Transcript_12114/g.25001  ORF Transcript_12114/g.25001 Transcript_12114/m.25001 type:complete len:232 (+) Transcript_12114:79-774(+)
MTKKILCLSTSAPYYGKSLDHPTGLWLEELAAAYMVFKKAGYEITIASPAGGPIPIDCNSLRGAFFTQESKEFLHDADAMDMFMHTKKISEVATPGDFDALYLPGGSGCCADFVNNGDVKSAIESTYSSGKIVAIVCHGPIALAECFKPDGTTPFVQGMTVTGFSDAEEEMVGGTSKVPFLIETRFVEQGAKYEKAEAPFGSHICVDGNLVTGQNPASSTAAAEKVVELLA